MHYRIAELENDPDSPKNLGEIEPFLQRRPLITTDSSNVYLPDVKYLESSQLTISAEDLPQKSTYYVFTHSPIVKSSLIALKSVN